VDSLGQGRVFTGKQALDNGLVDVLGGLADAIDIAKVKAGLAEEASPAIDVYPKRKGLFSSALKRSEERKVNSFLQAFRSLNAEHLLAISPFKLKIK